MALNARLKKAILCGVLSEAISLILLLLPMWIEHGEHRILIVFLGVLGGFLNLPALIFWFFAALCAAWIFEMTDTRWDSPDVYFSLVAITQTAIWIRVWWNTFKPRSQK